MTYLELPSTGTEQPPLFTTLEQCRLWRKTLPVTAPVQAQAQLVRQLHLLDRYTLPGDQRLAMLEELRESVYLVQGESAKKFLGKSLPLAPPEQAAYDSTHSLWLALTAGYMRCIDDCLSPTSTLKLQAALICQRALVTLIDDQNDRIRAGFQVEASFWRLANKIYAGAETLARTTAAADDTLRNGKPMSPAAAYVELMLVAAASLHELPPRQQQWIMDWAHRWAGKVAILMAAPALETPALPLCVDLESSAPAIFRPQSGKGARWLETTELRNSLKKRLGLLAKGETNMARLGLGEDCVLPACGDLLRRVYPRWVKGGVLRRHERHPMSGACRFVVGVDAIHYYIAGHPFKAPTAPTSEDLQHQRERLATFDTVQERINDEFSRQQGFQLENWEVMEDWNLLDQSNGGLRLVRPVKQSGGRLAIGQLIAVQPTGASSLLLGVVRWAQVANDMLTTGIQLFPGKPQAIAVRGTGVMVARETWRPGFYIPEVLRLELPACVVLPHGSFKPNRIMEAWDEGDSGEIKLKEILDRGVDFERVSCVSLLHE